MAYRRAHREEAVPDVDALTARMVGIGMNFAADGVVDADIESTLLHAAHAGMVDHDLRVLSVLTTWFGVHHAHVNADRLIRLLGAASSPRVRAYWAAIAQWQQSDRRFGRLVVLHDGDPVELLPVGNDFQVRRRGEDERFVGTALRVPLGTLRDRAEDVLIPSELVRRHAGYKNRVLMGPTWRADVWTELEKSPDGSVASIARRVSCSFATAWQTAQDFKVWRAAASTAAE